MPWEITVSKKSTNDELIRLLHPRTPLVNFLPVSNITQRKSMYPSMFERFQDFTTSTLCTAYKYMHRSLSAPPGLINICLCISLSVPPGPSISTPSGIMNISTPSGLINISTPSGLINICLFISLSVPPGPSISTPSGLLATFCL